METVDGKRARYLGDGAYISEDSYKGYYIVTAGNHDPDQATDRVYLGPIEMRALVGFVAEIEASETTTENTENTEKPKET